MSYIEKGEMETALDEYADELPGLMLYYPSLLLEFRFDFS